MNAMTFGTGTRSRFGLVAACAVMVLVLLMPGCSTPNGGGRTLKQTEMDVSWSMTRYRNGCARGAVTLAEKDQVNSAYAGFEAAYKEALKAANDDRSAPAPENVKESATEVIRAIQAISF